MNMKYLTKNITIITLLMMIVFLVSCGDMLEEEPKAQVTLGELSPATLEQSIIGAYEPWTRSRGRLWESTIGIGLELMAEYGMGSPAGQTGFSNYVNLKSTPNAIAPCWITLYEAIGRANLLIATLEADTKLTQELKNRAYGEAQFIRAVSYYLAVRIWGKVPLRLTPINNAEDTALPLSSINEIYDQIVKDLEAAELTLPATVPASQAGRATAGAAKVALADVFLTMAGAPLSLGTPYFTKARDKAKEVIDNKATYGYELELSFETIYSPTLPTNKEDVFSIKFQQVIQQGSFLASYYADDRAALAGLSVTGLRFGGAIKSPLITGWDKNDLRRKFNIYDSLIINGVKVKANLLSGMDYFFGKYKDPAAPQDTGNGNDFYLYRYADALLIFAEAENRVNGPTAAAYDAINKVRRRGYGVNINTVSATADLPAGLDETQFDDLVFRERGYEFMAEAKRWFDMVRTSRVTSTLNAVANATKPDPGKIFFALPDVELQNNPLASE
jgi:hypothetical protein